MIRKHLYIYFLCVAIYVYVCIMYTYTGATLYFNDVWRSADLGVTWELSAPQASWAARSSMSAVYTGGAIVLMGGMVVSSEDIYGYICIHIYVDIYRYICLFIYLYLYEYICINVCYIYLYIYIYA